jgi:hypothetical protein
LTWIAKTSKLCAYKSSARFASGIEIWGGAFEVFAAPVRAAITPHEEIDFACLTYRLKIQTTTSLVKRAKDLKDLRNPQPDDGTQDLRVVNVPVIVAAEYCFLAKETIQE